MNFRQNHLLFLLEWQWKFIKNSISSTFSDQNSYLILASIFFINTLRILISKEDYFKLGANLSKEENVRTPYQELLFWPCTYLKMKRWSGLWKFHYAKFWLGSYFRWSSKRERVCTYYKNSFRGFSKFDLTSLWKTHTSVYEFMRILTANQIKFNLMRQRK